MSERIVAVLNQIEVQQQPQTQIYRGAVKVSPQQMRAAIEALPFEVPKLSATAIATMDGKTFAEALDRAIERSRGPALLNGPVEQLPPSELKKPFPNYRRF
jgi:hypothetical protein